MTTERPWPGLVVDAGLRALDRGIPVVVARATNQAIAFLPHQSPAASAPQCPAGLAPRLPSSVLEKRPGSPEGHKTGDYKDQ
jgi:hypothetical protein